MRDLNRLLRGNGLYIKQAPTQLGLNTTLPPLTPLPSRSERGSLLPPFDTNSVKPAALLVGFDNL